MTAQTPRLRVERFAIVESRSTMTFIRDIPLHAGLNIVWAEDAAPGSKGSEVDRAGHGVGKSTFCLMLRSILGDDGTSVRTMRSHLAEHYDSGGVAAEVTAGAERFAVFRSFGSRSFARRGGTIDNLFDASAEADTLEFPAYVAALGEQACLQHLPSRTLPVTRQCVEWGHVLCWIARDQGLGLRRYFEWRSIGGTGLQRRKKDPPALMRLVLGLVSDEESTADASSSTLATELVKARETLRNEEQRAANTRAIIESQLRRWAGVSETLAMYSDDLFSGSVERTIRRKSQHLEAQTEEDRASIAELDGEIVALAVDARQRTLDVELRKAKLDEIVALREGDQASLDAIGERRRKLLTISGRCWYGDVAFDECTFVRDQRSVVRLAAERDARGLAKALGEQEPLEASALAAYNAEASVLRGVTVAIGEKQARREKLAKTITERARLLGQGDAIRDALTGWRESHSSPETEKLRLARQAVADLERAVGSAKTARALEQQAISAREARVGRRLAHVATAFGVSGQFLPFDEDRPFRMPRAHGDAYTVLEILLGDLACARESAEPGGGAHPGLLILDCPRERDTGPHVYGRFLELVDEVCREAPTLQVIVTTTTPPPGLLREPPVRILRLSQENDEDLLLKRRVDDLLSRTAAPPDDLEHEDPDEDDDDGERGTR